MSELFGHGDLLKNFDGTAPVFPLPDIVLFPHALLPLHIFEPRYRTMIADAISNNRLVALARLKDDFQDLYHTKQAPIFAEACLGRVTADQRLPDGRFYLILEGVVRVTIDEEVETDKPYRVARMTMHRNRYQYSSQFDPDGERARLLELCRNHIGDEASRKGMLQVLESDLKLGSLCDILAYACPLPIEQKQRLLEAYHVELRVRLLLQYLSEMIREQAGDEPFPPAFSPN